MISIGDVLQYQGDGYPDMRIVAIVDEAVALERMDGVIEPLVWYSKEYIERLVDEAWTVNHPKIEV